MRADRSPPSRSRPVPERGPRTHALAFAVVVAICVAQIAWWIYFQLAEAGRLERAGELLARGDVAAAAQELGADRDASLRETARRRKVMFLSEGIALSALGLVGVVFFYLAIGRERRLRLMQERFLTGTTHEMKTPVASIRLGLESLRAGTLPPDRQPAYLAAMLREVDRLEVGLDNLLAAADVQRLRAPANPQPGDLAADVRASVDALRARAATAQVELVVGDLPPTEVVRDAATLRHALRNVLDNAIKFSPPRSRVDVALIHDGDRAIVSVEDRGIGVRAADLPHLGQRFYRGANAVHRGGSGLGLYLAREVLRAAGGDLALASAGEGHGCRVSISLPRRTR